ncbi:MAG: sialidase family protein [Candidatus Thermoplasmatota archaeon]
MRVSALLLLATLVLAGCLGSSSTSSSQPPGSDPFAPYRLDCSISNWEDPCTVLASPNMSPSKTEIDIAVNPTDPLNAFVASKDNDPSASGCVWAVGQVTFDGGKSWETTIIGGPQGERAPSDILFGWNCITDPILTYNKEGTLFYALQVYEYDPVGLPVVNDPVLGSAIPPDGGLQLLAVSHDGGRTFPETYVLHVGDSGATIFHDYMRIGASPTTGTVFTIWNQITASVQSIPVLVAYKMDAQRAEVPVYFPNLPEAAGDGLSTGESGIVVDNTGRVYAWLGGFNSPNKVFFATSTDDGATFSLLQEAFAFTPMGTMANVSFRHGTVVDLAVDNSGGSRDGCLYAAWGGQEEGTVGPSDVYVRTSCDQGQSWSAPILVNSGAREDGQWMVRPSVDGLGTVHLVYMTRAYDPDHTLVDAEHAYSLDGGATWTTERVTGFSYSGDKGVHQSGFPFFGDYIGISSAGDTTYMGFPECITEVCEIGVAVSRHTPHNADVEPHTH